MNILTCKVALLALALGGIIPPLPLCQAAERGWSFAYNTQGQFESSDGPRTDVSDITRYEYDAKGHLARIINAPGHTTTFSNFDTAGNPKTVVDSNSVITNLTYAPKGWMNSLSTATGTVRLEHNAVGDIIKIIRADNSWSTYTWDEARRLIQGTNNAGEQIEFDLDPMGNRTAVRIKDKTGQLTKQHQWVYDELGRLLRSVGAAGQASQTQYDLNDNPIALTNPRNHGHQRAFDSLNRLVMNTDPLNGITQLEYDAQDNLKQVRDPRGVTTQYQYDGLGNLTRVNSPDSGATHYQYDAAGNVTQQVDARGVVTTFTYDVLNRLTARRYPTNPALDVQFHYDSIAAGNKGIGRLTAVEDVNGVLNYTYDAQGNVTTQRQTAPENTATQPEQIGYGYDAANRLSRIDYPTGFSIVYSRNTTGQISQVQIRQGTEQPSAFASNITYQPFGPLKNLTWANGTTLQRTYDLDYRLTAQTVAGQSETYTYDAQGNMSDPIGLTGGLNTFEYAVANPLNVIDPKGLMGYPNGPTLMPGKQVARYGFTACLGMYCASYIQGDPTATGSLGVGGLGAAILVCAMPPPPETNCGPDWKEHIPDGGVVSGAPGRAGLFLGGQLNPDGTLCAYGGLMGGIPGPNYSTGPIEYKQ